MIICFFFHLTGTSKLFTSLISPDTSPSCVHLFPRPLLTAYPTATPLLRSWQSPLLPPWPRETSVVWAICGDPTPLPAMGLGVAKCSGYWDMMVSLLKDLQGKFLHAHEENHEGKIVLYILLDVFMSAHNVWDCRSHIPTLRGLSLWRTCWI